MEDKLIDYYSILTAEAYIQLLIINHESETKKKKFIHVEEITVAHATVCKKVMMSCQSEGASCTHQIKLRITKTLKLNKGHCIFKVLPIMPLRF